MLSVIMPVYNEATTFEKTLKQVINQPVGMKKEIIIVESNSTDGTRDLVLQYKGKTPGGTKIKIILEEKPQGKGHALKAGFRVAKGDIILIQDGDTEYKVTEYPKLLKPIIDGRTTFVLGSRHAEGSTWKIRKMHNKFYANLINTGHWFYTTLFNIIYGVRLTDPATMFKVFKRDAAKGIRWKSNYFELDWEIVAKLIRKGHKPIEVPVSYDSRTVEEGKKIRFFRDGFLVFWAIVSFRFRSL